MDAKEFIRFVKGNRNGDFKSITISEKLFHQVQLELKYQSYGKHDAESRQDIKLYGVMIKSE